jgi:hypothetical protein
VVPTFTINEVEVVELDKGLVTNVPVAPDGSPDTDKDTFPVNPFCGVIETVYTPAWPGYTDWCVVDVIEKSGVFGAAHAAAADIPNPVSTRTQSNATSGLRLALLAVL